MFRILIVASFAALVAVHVASAHAQAAPETTISAAQRARLDAEIVHLPMGPRDRFETLYQDWKNSWEQPGIRTSSNPAARRNTVEFRTPLSLGPQALPLVVDKLLQRDEFFALQLYDAL